MRKLVLAGAGSALFAISTLASAATLTSADEATCNCNGAACSPNPVCAHLSGSYPPSTGCSLREPLQDIADVAGSQGKPNCDAGAYESSSLMSVTLQSFDVD